MQRFPKPLKIVKSTKINKKKLHFYKNGARQITINLNILN